MIERVFGITFCLCAFIVACIVGFIVVALLPHMYQIGDMLYDTFRVLYIFMCIAGGIGLIELWGIVHHRKEMRKIMQEKAWLDADVGGAPGELFYTGDRNVTHISAIKEAAPMMSYGDMLGEQIQEKQGAIVTAFDEGIPPHQIAQHSKKGVGYIYDVLIKAGRRP